MKNLMGVRILSMGCHAMKNNLLTFVDLKSKTMNNLYLNPLLRTTAYTHLSHEGYCFFDESEISLFSVCQFLINWCKVKKLFLLHQIFSSKNEFLI